MGPQLQLLTWPVPSPTFLMARLRPWQQFCGLEPHHPSSARQAPLCEGSFGSTWQLPGLLYIMAAEQGEQTSSHACRHMAHTAHLLAHIVIG